MLLAAITSLARAEEAFRFLPGDAPKRLFGGAERRITATFQNPGNRPTNVAVTLRLLQTSSATAVFIREKPWKTLRVLPGQTVVETATLELPDVRAETRFVLQWLAATNRLLGLTEILAYPTNLLFELEALAGEPDALGVFDPRDELKPALRAVGVAFRDLAETGVADFRGRLAILGPFRARAELPGDLSERIREMASKGVAAVWLLPPPRPRDKLAPSFYSVPVGRGTVVVVQDGLVPDLARQPGTQLALLHCCRLALQPEPPSLPNPDPLP